MVDLLSAPLAMWKFIDRYEAKLNADAVDWYPGPRVGNDCHENSLDLVACAQYQLFEDGLEPERKGGIVLLEAVRNDACGDAAQSLKCLSVVDEMADLPGILDMKWIKIGSGS